MRSPHASSLVLRSPTPTLACCPAPRTTTHLPGSQRERAGRNVGRVASKCWPDHAASVRRVQARGRSCDSCPGRQGIAFPDSRAGLRLSQAGASFKTEARIEQQRCRQNGEAPGGGAAAARAVPGSAAGIKASQGCTAAIAAAAASTVLAQVFISLMASLQCASGGVSREGPTTPLSAHTKARRFSRSGACASGAASPCSSWVQI